LSKRTRQKRSGSERILWILSLFLVGSMVISLVIVALPSAPAPTPTPYPTITPIPHPTATPSPVPTASPVPATAPAATATLAASPTVTPTASIMPSPTVTPTEPVIGPELPTASPTVTPSLSSLASPNPAAATPLVFAVTGDSRDNPGMYQQILDAVAADGSQFLVNTGDLVAEDQLGLWQDFQAEMVGFSKPFYPVPGNHDTYHGDMNDYLQYSGAPAAHYSFDVASVHMTFADSHDGGIGAAELGWLRNDLSATTQPVKMVFVHHPAFDPDGTDHIMAYGNEQFMNLMAEQGVDYVIAGHIHAYARGERNGVVYIYTGGGGSPLYSGEHPQSFYHYLRITVNSEDVQVEIVRM
jgi:3',5'-cyclic AMP phosphodiesterase CpdA